MNQPISPLEIMRGKEFSTDSTLGHLREAFLLEPTVMNELITYHFASTKNLPFTMLTQMLGNEETIYDNVFRWDYAISNSVRHEIHGLDGTPPADGRIGAGFSEFRFLMKDNPYGYGDLVRLGDDYTTLRVLDTADQVGGMYSYRAVLVTQDPTEFAPISLFDGSGEYEASGFRIGQYSEEGSWRGGGVSGFTSGKLEQHLHIIRKEYELTRSAALAKIRITIPREGGGQPAAFWITEAEYLLMQAFFVEREMLYVLGKRYGGTDSNKAGTFGERGGVLKAGAGLRQQVPPAHRIFYDVRSDFDLDMVDGVLAMLSRLNNRHGGDTRFAVGGGYLFMKRLNEAIAKRYQGTFTLVDSKFVRNFNGSATELSFGSYFRHYKFNNGNEFEVFHIPFYDDVEMNAVMDPTKMGAGYPAESGRGTIFNLATATNRDSKSNMRRVKFGEQDVISFSTGGSIDGKGNLANGFGTVRSNGYDGTRMTAMAEEGVVALDPLTMAEFIPNVLQW